MADVFAKALRNSAEYDAQQPPVDPESQFTRGARAGVYGMGSGLRNVAGLAGEAAGSQDFAQGQYAEAQRLAERAQATGPRIASYSDLEKQGMSLRNVGDYAAGVVGGVVPSLALGLGAGLGARTALSGLVRATAAYTPGETGDVVAKMRQDNHNAPLTQDQMIAAPLTGLASAATQSVVPAILGGKIAGRAAPAMLRTTPGQSLRQAAAHNAFEIPLEGAMEGSGELIKQYGANPNAPTDWTSIRDAAIAGTIGGAPMAGVGTGADYVRGRQEQIGAAARSAGDLVGRGVDRAKELGGQGVDQAGDAVRAAGDAAKPAAQDAWSNVTANAKAAYDGVMESDLGKNLVERSQIAKARAEELLNDPDTPDQVKERVRQAADRFNDKANQTYIWAAAKAREVAGNEKVQGITKGVRDVIDQLRTAADDKTAKAASGEFMGNPEDLAAAAANPEQAAELVRQSDETANAHLQSKAEEVLNDPQADPAAKASLAEALKNPLDPANRTAIASAVTGHAAYKRTMDGVKSVSDKLDAFVKGVKKGTTKRSEDFSGIHDVIADELAPNLPEAVMNNPEARDAVASQVRRFIELASQDDMGSQLKSLDEFKRNHELKQINESMVQLLGPDAETILGNIYHATQSADTAQANAFFGNLQGVRDAGKTYGSFAEALRKNYTGGDKLDFHTAAKTADGLLAWARGRGKLKGEAGAFHDRQVVSLIEKVFGPNAKHIMRLLEREATKDQQQPGKSGRTQEVKEQEVDDVTAANEADLNDEVEHELTKGEAKEMYVGKDGTPSKTVSESLDGDSGINGLMRSVAHQKSTAPDQATAKSTTEAKIKKLEAEYPGYKASFVSINDYMRQLTGGKVEGYFGKTAQKIREQFDELGNVPPEEWGTYGYIKLTGKENDEDALAPWEQRAVRLDTSTHAKSPSRLQFGQGTKGIIADAIKLTRHMDKNRPYMPSDDNLISGSDAFIPE